MSDRSPERGLREALVAVHDILESLDIDHALCGGLAVNFYRDDLRTTIDVDLYLICSAPQLVSVAREFEARGWTVHPAWRQAELVRLERGDLPRVDLLVASTDFEQETIRRSVRMIVADRPMRVLAPEDLIVFKLVAGRARDYEAVAAILNSRRGKVDSRYVRRRLENLGMIDRWTRVVEEARLEAQDLG